ncbi:hypothetical protein ABG067_006419 [Albugo candida]
MDTICTELANLIGEVEPCLSTPKSMRETNEEEIVAVPMVKTNNYIVEQAKMTEHFKEENQQIYLWQRDIAGAIQEVYRCIGNASMPRTEKLQATIAAAKCATTGRKRD